MHQDLVAVSIEQLNELLDVLARPRLYRFLDQDLGANLIQTLYSLGVPFTPTERVTDCRDPKDNKFLELALVAGADLIVSSDADLLVLSPWRGIPILKPAEYLALKSA